MRASSGQVSSPARAVGAFYAWLDTPASCPHNTETQINYNRITFDVSGWMNTTGTTGNGGTRGRYTPQLPGIYRFSAMLLSGTGGLIFLNIWKNGSGYATLGADGSVQRVEGTILMKMNGTTDYVDIRLYQFVNQTLTTGDTEGAMYFCGEYVGAE